MRKFYLLSLRKSGPTSIYGSINLKRFLFFCAFNILLSVNSFADYTIPAGTTVDATTLTSQGGTLTINGTLSLPKNTNCTLIFMSVIINAPSGKIYWEQNGVLTFPEGTTIVINNPNSVPDIGLQPTGGTANQAINIGGIVIAVSNDNSNKGDFSFAQFNAQGGLPQYTITSNSPVCAGNSISLKISPDKSASGVTYSYEWSISPSSATFSPNNTSSVVSTTPGIGNYTITCIATAKASGDFYRATKTISVTVKPGNTWLGVNTNWNDAQNWCPGIPTKISDVTIPATANNPVIPASTFGVANITIASGASLFVNGTLQIAGKIINNGTFDATKGTIEFIGSAAQSFSGSLFVDKTINNLKISNTALSLAATINDTLNVTGNVSFGISNATFYTNANLTLKSTVAGTASIADMTNNGANSGNNIIGKANIERYVPARKAWYFLSVPTQPGQSIHDAWQEGQPANNNTSSLGRGIQITGTVAPSTANGIDLQSASPSMKYYNPITNAYVGVTSTMAPFDPTLGGYFTFIRGDRSANGTYSPVTETTLRTKGDLYTGLQTVNLIPGKFTPVNNPYASAIDLRKISQSTSTFIYVWDPNRGGGLGYGAFQTLSWDANTNSYLITPGGGSYDANLPNTKSPNVIESGQSFWVQTSANNAKINFTESAKAVTNNNGINNNNGIKRIEGIAGKIAQIRTNLYGISADGTALLTDGTLQQFNDEYSNDVDELDAKKIANTSENLSLKIAGEDLVVDRRQPLTEVDTIAYSFTSVKAQNYRFELIATNLRGTDLQGFLEDTYLNTFTALNLEGTTTYNFNIVNIPGSYASNRFRIVFKKIMAPLPVSFVSVKATQKNMDIAVEWKTENESNLQQFEVEKSVDGNQFTKAFTISANNKGVGTYNWLDKNTFSGYNYYRIRSVDINGQTAYTQIVKVLIGNVTAAINIYPNPAINGTVNLQFTNQPAGVYYARLINPIGQVVVSKQIIHAEGSSTETIKLKDASAKGIYQLEVTQVNGILKVIKVVF